MLLMHNLSHLSLGIFNTQCYIVFSVCMFTICTLNFVSEPISSGSEVYKLMIDN